MTKKNTLIIVAILVLSPLIISYLAHYLERSENKSEVVNITVPVKTEETNNT